MVNVGILDADTPLAGEIIRILIHHPETDLSALISPSLLGRSASSFHHGLIGEQPLNFTDKLNLEDLDILILPRVTSLSESIINKASNYENLRLILVSDETIKNSPENFEPGVSEVNRKALVRGARYAYIPSPVIVPALIALVPLGRYLLLNSDIEIEVTLPADMTDKIDPRIEAQRIEDLIKLVQNSFVGKVNLVIVGQNDSERGLRSHITLKTNLPVDEIEKIYEESYDDHNFTFITGNELSEGEVEGTHKHIMRLTKPEPEILTIESVADARMRGGAGETVHVLNLFFGLHEKTGLELKPARFLS